MIHFSHFSVLDHSNLEMGGFPIGNLFEDRIQRAQTETRLVYYELVVNILCTGDVRQRRRMFEDNSEYTECFDLVDGQRCFKIT